MTITRYVNMFFVDLVKYLLVSCFESQHIVH